jgi:hypothetical protein
MGRPKLEKPKIAEEDIVKIEQMRVSIMQRWFNDNIVSSIDDIKHICVAAIKMLNTQIGAAFKDESYPLPAIVYNAFMEEVATFLMTKRNTYNAYAIQVNQNFHCGYTNNQNTDNEKIGNFLPFIVHRGVNQPLKEENITVQRSTKMTRLEFEAKLNEWIKINVPANANDLMALKAGTFNRIQNIGKQYSIEKAVTVPEVLICPMVGIFHECILDRLRFLKQSQPHKTDVSVNIMGIYQAKLVEVGNDNPNYMGYFVLFEPKNFLKLSLKDDAIAYNKAVNGEE